MSPEVEAAIIAAGVGILTLIGAVYGTRKTSQDTKDALNQQLTEQGEQLDKTLKTQGDQLDRTLTEQRTRTLNERFATAAGQLGSDKPPPVRLAGVYAMAGLADDWEENRQTCVDVLCAYLRIPYEPDPVGLEPDSLMTTAARHLPSPPSPPSLRRRRRTPANIRPCEASERRRLLPGVCQPLAVQFTGDERSPSSPHAGD